MASPGDRHRLFTPEGGDANPTFRIGLTPIAVADWFEGGEADPAARKDPLAAAHPAETWGETDGSRAAQAEAAAMIVAWLRARGVGAGLAPDLPPLQAAARLVADDLCLMERRAGGWTLTAASLCAPSFFVAAEAVGQPLAGLHAPVTGFNDTLLPRVARIFDHLAPDVIVERRNWSVVSAPDLFALSAAPYRAALATMSDRDIAAALHIRRERQTLRRLPHTGGMLFTIRIWLEPLGDVLADAPRRTAFAAAWDRLASDEGAAFRAYKRLDLFDAAVAQLLSG